MKKNLESSREYKKIKVPFTIDIKSLEENPDYFHFEGYASTFGNIDRDGDIIKNDAFDSSINRIIQNDEKLPVLWQHNMDTPLGIYLTLKVDEKGLFVEGRMPKNDTFVSGRVVPQMKVGSVSKMSIGFFIIESEWGTVDGKSIRFIKDVELLEISLVTIPANPLANITSTKAASSYSDLPLGPRDMAWDKDDALGRIRLATDSLEKPSENYKNAFFWYDEENADKFSAYKLPFTDIVDGDVEEFRAIPRGIFAVVAALRGARGGVDIPDDDKVKIIENVNKYYAKMRREFADDSIISPFEEDTKTLIKNCKKLSDVEKVLKRNFFTNTQSQIIISTIAELKAGEHPCGGGSDQSDSDDADNAEVYQDIKSSLKQLKKEFNNG